MFEEVKLMDMNDKGLTLVEVLAAVVILGILFVGIMSIFPQMTLFNAKTETKLDTMNLARQEMDQIVSTSAPDVWLGTEDPIGSKIYQTFEMKLPNVLVEALGYAEDVTNTNLAFKRYQRNDVESGYQFEGDIYLSCEALMSEPSGGLPCNDPSLTQLYKVHLKVFNGAHLSSETYSFIKYNVDELGD